MFQKRKVPYHVAIEVGGWEVIKQYVAMGLGISIVTGMCIREADRERLCVRNLRSYFPQRSYGVVVRKGKVLSTEARSFIDLIRPGLFVRQQARLCLALSRTGTAGNVQPISGRLIDDSI